MSTTYGATGLGQTAASTRRVSSFFKRYWGAFQERRKRQRLRAALCDLSDRELMDIGTDARRDRLRRPRTEVSTRGASDPERPPAARAFSALAESEGGSLAVANHDSC